MSTVWNILILIIIISIEVCLRVINLLYLQAGICSLEPFGGISHGTGPSCVA